MHESWAMLNFLNPNVFTSPKAFDAAFGYNQRAASGIHASQELMDRCNCKGGSTRSIAAENAGGASAVSATWLAERKVSGRVPEHA